jgi:WXXGXW repeat (2 copies)
MTTLLRTLALSTVLLVPATAHAQVSFGITIGPPPPLRASVVRPQPHPDNIWVDGYWYPQGSHYVWHAGYWTAAPYAGAYWNEPYYTGHQYVAGYWDGDHGRQDHDHHSDRGKQRDYHDNDHH